MIIDKIVVLKACIVVGGKRVEIVLKLSFVDTMEYVIKGCILLASSQESDLDGGSLHDIPFFMLCDVPCTTKISYPAGGKSRRS